MRTDCRHCARTTTPEGSRIESCVVGAARAPGICPEQCPLYEKRRLTTTGFEQGSLAEADESEPTSATEAELLADVAEIVGESAPDAVAAEAARRSAEQRRRQKRKRRRIR